jgi:hypothetical protein
MSFEDALLIEEMNEAAREMGLSDQVAHFIGQAIGNNTGFFRRRASEGGIGHAIECQLAVFRGMGILGQHNEYPGPMGRVGQGR